MLSGPRPRPIGGTGRQRESTMTASRLSPAGDLPGEFGRPGQVAALVGADRLVVDDDGGVDHDPVEVDEYPVARAVRVEQVRPVEVPPVDPHLLPRDVVPVPPGQRGDRMRQRDWREAAVVVEHALRARHVLAAEQPVRVQRVGEVGRLLARPRHAADQREQRQRGDPGAADQRRLNQRPPRNPALGRSLSVSLSLSSPLSASCVPRTPRPPARAAPSSPPSSRPGRPLPLPAPLRPARPLLRTAPAAARPLLARPRLGRPRLVWPRSGCRPRSWPADPPVPGCSPFLLARPWPAGSRPGGPWLGRTARAGLPGRARRLAVPPAACPVSPARGLCPVPSGAWSLPGFIRPWSRARSLRPCPAWCTALVPAGLVRRVALPGPVRASPCPVPFGVLRFHPRLTAVPFGSVWTDQRLGTVGCGTAPAPFGCVLCATSVRPAPPPRLGRIPRPPHLPGLRHSSRPCSGPPRLGSHSRHRWRVGMARDKNTGLAIALCTTVALRPYPCTPSPPVSPKRPYLTSPNIHTRIINRIRCTKCSSFSVADPGLAAYRGRHRLPRTGSTAKPRSTARPPALADREPVGWPRPRSYSAEMSDPRSYFRTDIESHLDFLSEPMFE